VKNENGVGMVTIQKLMGHKNIQTTALYCDVSDEQLANAANVFDAFSDSLVVVAQ
jgi:integrase/recombinase XerD